MFTRRSLQPSMFLVVPAALALGWAGSVIADDNPATGQTTCYDSGGTVIPCAGTGQDGEIQRGKTLSYQNNGRTIRDLNTGLTWEKKSDDGSIHDWDNLYTWEEAFAVHVFILNNICQNDETVTCSADTDCVAVGGRCGFAGKRDWRLPNVKELHSIVNYQNSFPAVSAAFNTNCVAGATVLTGSCTDVDLYWSSTSFADYPSFGRSVDFGNGFLRAYDDKGGEFHVRAVRGGL